MQLGTRLGWAALSLVASGPSVAQTDGPAERELAAVVAFLDSHCAACHTGPAPEADFALPLDEPFGPERRADWQLVRERVARGEMPPPDRPRPSRDELERFVAWIDARHPVPPGGPAPTLRRLNRTEYENTIRDLTGVFLDAHDRLPADEVGGGFDNIGDVLTVSDALLLRYLAAAEDVAARALRHPDSDEPLTLVFEPDDLRGGDGMHRGWRGLSRNGTTYVDCTATRAGAHTLRARATAAQAGPERAELGFVVDDDVVLEASVDIEQPELADFEVTVELEPGPHRIGIAFLNDYYAPDDPDPSNRDRNLYVARLEIVPPVEPPPPTPLETRLLDPSIPWRERLDWLATRAWRRPPSRPELDRLAALWDPALAEPLAWRQVLVALLVSPRFLFRVEREPQPGTVGELDDHELAVRLSYFLWSTMPDERLFELAAAGRLGTRAELARQARRLARSARATAFVESFAAQWLQLGALAGATPHPERFPEFDSELAAAMRAETLMLVEAVLFEERDVRTLLDPGFTFLNERLARHYGIEGVRGSRMRRVALAGRAGGSRRGGLVTHASILTSTSDPGRTSPVKRGKWMLAVLFDAAPPPPPPGIEPLPASGAAGGRTLRERLSRHREEPSCATCHATMDVLGLGLENFDAIGAWRSHEAGGAIDAGGELPDGRRFDGPEALARVLAADERFVRALVSKLTTYALGRELTRADDAALDRLVTALPREPSFVDIIEAIVTDDLFRTRPGEAE